MLSKCLVEKKKTFLQFFSFINQKNTLNNLKNVLNK
jgi:hypothetical protein